MKKNVLKNLLRFMESGFFIAVKERYYIRKTNRIFYNKKKKKDMLFNQ